MESDIQLRLRPEEQSLSSIQDHDHEQDQQLPPMDGGKDAWLFLAACFMIEALIWGTPLHTINHFPANLILFRLLLRLWYLPGLLQHP